LHIVLYHDLFSKNQARVRALSLSNTCKKVRLHSESFCERSLSSANENAAMQQTQYNVVVRIRWRHASSSIRKQSSRT